jgi:hypothetical protein
VSDAGWGHAIRWPMLALGEDIDFVLRRETADRELEHHLDAPPRIWGDPFIQMLAYDDSHNMTSRINGFVARWERQQGRFATFQAVGVGSGVAFIAPTSSVPWEYGVLLPPELIPLEDVTGYCPALVEWFVNPAVTSQHLYGAVTKRPSDGRWIVATRRNFGAAWGGTVNDVFSVHATFPTAQ